MPIASSSRGHSHHKLGFWDLGPVLTMHPLLGDPAAPGAAASLVTKPHAEPTAQSTSEPQPCGHLPVAAPGPPQATLGEPRASSAPRGGCPPRPGIWSAPPASALRDPSSWAVLAGLLPFWRRALEGGARRCLSSGLWSGLTSSCCLRTRVVLSWVQTLRGKPSLPGHG